MLQVYTYMVYVLIEKNPQELTVLLAKVRTSLFSSSFSPRRAQNVRSKVAHSAGKYKNNLYSLWTSCSSVFFMAGPWP